MDPIAIIGAVFALIKIIIEVTAWLKAHPEITERAREIFTGLHGKALEAENEMRSWFPDLAANVQGA